MSNQPNEWFRILDLRPGAGLEEVKRSYRELAKVWHPDRFAHDSSLLRKAHEKMNELNHAYEQICGLLERFGADAFGHGRQSAAPAPAGGAPSAARDPSRYPPEPAPASPPMAAFGRAGDGCVRLNWSPVYGAGSYHVKRSTVSGGPYAVIARDVAWTEYVDTTAVNGTRYFYVVSSVDGGQESPNSPELSVQPLAAPAAPTELKAAVTANGASVQLEWAQSASKEVTWTLIYRAADGGEFKQIAQISAGTAYVDGQVVRGAVLSYAVAAVNSNAQQSERSAAVSVRVP